MPGVDSDAIRHALAVARTHGVRRLCLKTEDFSFRALLEEFDETEIEEVEELGPPPVPAVRELTAPCVGYYRSPDRPLGEGQAFQEGQNLGGIAALGIVHELVATCPGEIVEVLVEDGQPVEYGQPLLRWRDTA